MFEAIQHIACLVTATVSLLYGTRICWGCGKRCNFGEEPAERKSFLQATLPAAILVYAFGFVIVFSYYFDSYATITMAAITSAVLLSHFVVSMAMPEMKRQPDNRRPPVADPPCDRRGEEPESPPHWSDSFRRA